MADFFEWVGRAPRGLHWAWAAWGFAGVALVLLTLNYRNKGVIDAQETRLQSIEAQLPQIGATLGQVLDRLDEIRAAQFDWPETLPGKRVGGPNAIDETVSAKSEVEKRKLAPAIFEITKEREALVNLVVKNEVSITNATLENPAQHKKDGPGPNYVIEIEVLNNSDHSVSFVVPRGQVFENAEPNTRRQNLVAAEAIERTLEPGASLKFPIKAHCLNHHRGLPVGQPANITPLKLRFPFVTQNDVWNGVSRVVGEPK